MYEMYDQTTAHNWSKEINQVFCSITDQGWLEGATVTERNR